LNYCSDWNDTGTILTSLCKNELALFAFGYPRSQCSHGLAWFCRSIYYSESIHGERPDCRRNNQLLPELLHDSHQSSCRISPTFASVGSSEDRTGTYPYPFLDVRTIGYGRALVNVMVLTTIFLGTGLAIVAISRKRTDENELSWPDFKRRTA
jgi:hypothetical protein